MENMFDGMMDALIDVLKEDLNVKQDLERQGITKLFDNSEAKKVEVTDSVMLNLYIPVGAYADEKSYYLIDNENILLYVGELNQESPLETIIKDVTSKNELINYKMALAKGDYEKVKEMFGDEMTLFRILSGADLGGIASQFI